MPLLSLLCLLLISGSTTTAKVNNKKWTVIGPGGGGAMFYPVISPHDPNTALVACDMTGSYITHDAGQSWRMFNLRQPSKFFVFDPQQPKTIYAQAESLWRSTDSGMSWNLVYPNPKIVQRINIAGDHADTNLILKEGTIEQLTALAVDPNDSQILYSCMDAGGKSSLQISNNQGQSWAQNFPLTQKALRIYVDPASPRNNRTLYVVNKSSISKREQERWTEGAAPVGKSDLLDVVASFKEGSLPTFYAISSEILSISSDGGKSWRESHLPGESAEFEAIAACLHHPETAYVSFKHLLQDGKEWFGVARTNDEGATWKLVWKESDLPAENIKDAWISPTFGAGWGENPLSLGVSPNDPNLCYATDLGRTLRTADGGKNWQASYANILQDGSYTTKGLDVTSCYGVHFDPFDSRRMFITYTDIGLFRSENGGSGWLPSSNGLPHSWMNTAYWVEFDPLKKDRMWVVMSGTHDLPRPKMWRHTKLSTYQGGVCRSDDGGRTWKVANNGMPQTAATYILLDPHSPPEARILYVTGFGKGVYKSSDGGDSWTLKNTGIDGTEPMAWRLTLNKDGTLYLIVARRSEDGSFGNSADGALYRSSDGAEHWTKIVLPRGVNGPNGLSVDPLDSHRLYLAAWARDNHGSAEDGGVYLSTDSGVTWQNILKDPYIYDLTIDSHDPSTLFACGFDSNAWKSNDRGETWTRIRGYNFKWGHRVIMDPYDSRSIYVTTFGGSVWHGPISGDPEAGEDIATPMMRYSK